MHYPAAPAFLERFSQHFSLILSKLRKSKEQMRRYRLATAEHLSPEHVQIRLNRHDSVQPLSQLLPDSSCDIEAGGDNGSLVSVIDKMFAQLSEREQRVLQLRFGLIDGQDHTLEEIGQVLFITRERVRQIEAKALHKLRKPSRNYALRDYFETQGGRLSSIHDQILMRLYRALDADAEMRYEDRLEVREELETIEKYIDQYVTRGRTRVVDTRRQGSRVELFRRSLNKQVNPCITVSSMIALSSLCQRPYASTRSKVTLRCSTELMYFDLWEARCLDWPRGRREQLVLVGMLCCNTVPSHLYAQIIRDLSLNPSFLGAIC